ncbi:MAG: HAD-IIIC family phosphatase [Defluviitaleaceae bacterium]|nr:HAD-IIIC family phosphatase [Defluviitaleaceae bacterium]
MIKELKYPINGEEIIKKKKYLKRQFLDLSDFTEVRIAILSGSTIGDIADILELFLFSYEIKPIFYIGNYNQYYEETLFNTKDLISFRPDIILIHTTSRNVLDKDIFSKLNQVWEHIQKMHGCIIIQNNFELLYNHISEISELNTKIDEYKNKTFYVNDIRYLSAVYGLDEWLDNRSYYLYGYAFNVKAVPMFCHNIAIIIKSIYGKNHKCIVVDLDNTIWGGIVGEVGAEGIELGKGTALGEAYLDFQKFLKKMHSFGIILAACSKNNETIAKEAFTNSNMVLQLDDFAVFCANWNEKSNNIIHISKSLNILPQHLVFVDDNPAEREQVSSVLPQVAIIESNFVTDFIRYIDRGGYFYSEVYLEEDIRRNEYYRNEVKRKVVEVNSNNYGDYLSSLTMAAKIEPFSDAHIERITTLINKTNQFNLTGQRYSLNEVKKISINNNFVTLYADLNDKFGSSGIISALISEVIEGSAHVRLWVMSCRVFKRDVELAVFDSLVEECLKRGIKKIFGYYHKTDRNEFVSKLYESLGFYKSLGEVWVFDVDKGYVPCNKYIRMRKE